CTRTFSIRMPVYQTLNAYRNVVFGTLVILATSCGRTSTFVHQDPNFHIYVLMGQSNMAGRGEISGEFQDLRNERVLSINKELEWEVAKHPLHYDKPWV